MQAWGKKLFAYYRSGWAFLLPYLGVYLFYIWRGWPVNPSTREVELPTGQIISAALTPGPSPVPCLLHAFWLLHGIHLLLGFLATYAWFTGEPTQHFAGRKGRINLMDRLWPLVPWLCLALFLSMPGIYLEWPSDPWEHLRRITEWATHATTGGHSADYKSFYFFSYSILVLFPPSGLLTGLNAYSAAVCLLLAWQYYRLALTIGLNERWSFVFVLITCVSFGNACFSFYRYYGLATTMFSQLGAVALTRIIIERCGPRYGNLGIGTSERELTPRIWTNGFVHSPLASLGMLALIPLIALNHIQGIGIAALSFGAIAVWRVLEWKRVASLYLIAGVATLSVMFVIWWPKHPLVETSYRATGWLNAWYGFNIIDWPTPAADRAMLILGAFGVINLLFAVLLIRRNHIAGWLTLFPILALLTPIVALPFANTMAATDVFRIVTFHRMLFAIPSGLAIVCWLNLPRTNDPGPRSIQPDLWRFTGLIAAIGALVGITPQSPGQNRFWNLVSAVPKDLQFSSAFSTVTAALQDGARETRTEPVTTAAIANLLVTVAPTQFPFRERPIWDAPASSLSEAIGTLELNSPRWVNGDALLSADLSSIESSAWSTMAGAPYALVKIDIPPQGRYGLQNQTGLSTEAFAPRLVSIDPAKQYCVEASMQQIRGAPAESLLAIVWYDHNGRLLESNIAAPSGGGLPSGWLNGTYSYFGPIGKITPRKWTVYRKFFGPGTLATIPAEAGYLKIGALLNINSAPQAVVQLANVKLWEVSGSTIGEDGAFPQIQNPSVMVPDHRNSWTAASQTALLSDHWPASAVAMGLSGGPEIFAKARQLGMPLAKE